MGYETLLKRLISEVSPYLAKPWPQESQLADDDLPIPARALCMSWAYTANFLNGRGWEMSDKINSKEGDSLEDQIQTLKAAMLANASDNQSAPIPPPEEFRQDDVRAHNLHALLLAIVDALRSARDHYAEFSQCLS